MITATAIRAGKGKVDWQAATEVAAWDNADYIREACEAADGPNDEQVRAKALAMLAAGTANIDSGLTLAVRVERLLTDAAAQLIAEEAQSLIDAVEKERYEAAVALRDRKLEVCEAICMALGGRVNPTNDGYGGFGSVYFDYRSRRGHIISLRVSDHAQVAGGGWNEGTGERNGEADVSFVVLMANGIPTREEIRRAVAAALRAAE